MANEASGAVARGSTAVIMLSGGLDSTVALWWARSNDIEVLPISIEFGGRPRGELAAVELIARAAKVGPVSRMPLPFVRLAAQLPAYKDPKRPFPLGYIPLRNLLFYTLAAYHADAHGARYVVGGHLKEDSMEFPDATPAYFDEMNSLFRRSTDGFNRSGAPEVLLPLVGMTKTEVVRLGAELGAPFELTWSCWVDGQSPCGKCIACKDRAEAFEKAGLRDVSLEK